MPYVGLEAVEEFPLALAFANAVVGHLKALPPKDQRKPSTYLELIALVARDLENLADKVDEDIKD